MTEQANPTTPETEPNLEPEASNEIDGEELGKVAGGIRNEWPYTGSTGILGE